MSCTCRLLKVFVLRIQPNSVLSLNDVLQMPGERPESAWHCLQSFWSALKVDKIYLLSAWDLQNIKCFICHLVRSYKSLILYIEAVKAERGEIKNSKEIKKLTCHCTCSTCLQVALMVLWPE